MIAGALGVLALLAACTTDDSADTGEPIVIAGPLLAHEPVASLRDDTELPLTVTATDGDGVAEIKAFYRTVGRVSWEPILLVEADGAWTGTIPASRIDAPGVEYYFRGEDASAFAAVTYLPEAGQDGPFVVPVDVVGLPLPFAEGFEGTGATVFTLGWSDVPAGFGGYSWSPTPSRAHGGARSVAHPRGAPETTGLDDWLVSPPLDLSAVATAQVTWFEYGVSAAAGRHGLWISTTSPDPRQGTFEHVADLAVAPEDAWGRSVVVDLTAWVGAPVAYLAWRYEGDYADAWYLDDVEVRELGPDIQFTSVTWDRVDPGGATDVHVALRNATDPTARALVLSGVVDAASGTFDAPVTVGDLVGGAAVTTGIGLAVDAGHPDNARLPVALAVTDGDRTWTHAVDLVVGDASTATISASTTALGLVTATLGSGDPAAPDVEVPVVAAVLAAGTHTWTVDLTDQAAYLPPGPGPERWWLRVSAGVSGSITAFTLSYDGVQYVGDDLGTFTRGVEKRFFLPRPPVPQVQSLGSTPSPAAPGQRVTVQVALRNGGAATVGRTTAVVTTADPEVVVVDGGPFEIAAAGWASSATAALDVPVDLLATKVDSVPVPFVITVSDEVESWTLRGTLPVPAPVMRVIGARIEDDDFGDDDGVLDPDERAYLDIELANVGAANSFGGVSCTLSKASGALDVTVLHAVGGYGLLASGARKAEDAFEIQVTGGAAGDDVEMRLDCTDLQAVYTSTFDLELGEPPWTALTVSGDPAGDAVNGYDFDLVGGRFRSDGATLDLELVSATPYDPGTLFIEAWGNSPGGEHTYYQLVAQSGVGWLRGYELGVFTEISRPVVQTIDDRRVRISIDLTTAGLVLPTMNFGFASGFCGGTTYYCDQFPDSWGNPYQSGLVTSRWLPLSW